MRLLAIAAIPIALAGVWAAWRAARGRPVRRFALNAVVGVLLLAYFAITAALGIFWVANQELPIFDPHYLFGYMTLALVIVHVWINAPLLARFVRKRSAALSADGRAFRPSVRWAARGFAVIAFGGLCFWIGYSRGTSVVRVERGEPVERSARSGAGMADQVVVEGGRSTPLSRWYHERSKLSRTRAVGRASLDWATRPEPFETYPATEVIALPKAERVEMPASRALEGTRAAADVGPAEVSVAQVATLLHLTQGITDVSGVPGDPFYRRAAASSGALYPTVTHVIVREVSGLPAGVYHYEPKSHALHHVRDRAPDIGDAPFALAFSAIYYKSAWKYEERAYRYVLLDAGHVAANAIAAGRGLGLASRLAARFDDAQLADALGVELAKQGPLLVVAFGAERPAAAPAQVPEYAPAALELANDDVPTSVMLAAGRTALRATGRPVPPLPPAGELTARARGERIELASDAAADGDALTAVIERRRSQRRFGGTPMTRAQLGTLLARARGASVEDQRALRLHVFVMRVDGVPPGAYEYDRGALIRVRAGELASEVHAVALSQEVAERAAVVVALSVDVEQMRWPDASRGYRYGWLDAGITGGRLYLQAVALGLGVSSIGAFFDDDLTGLLALDREADYPALLVAIGPP